MPSKAYLKGLKEIPKSIQIDVKGSISIADEIYLTLKNKDMTPADLARLMGKSESEISKWMTGLHNFTFKTVRKIGSALGTDLIVSKSSKIKFYEELLQEKEEEIKKLKEHIQELDKNNVKVVYIFTESKYKPVKVRPCLEKASNCWSFKIYDEESISEKSNIKIEPVMASTLHAKEPQFVDY